MWIYRRMLRVSCTEHRTDENILLEFNTTRQLLGFVVGLRRKLSYFGHTMRDGGCELVKSVIQGKVSGKRRRGKVKKVWFYIALYPVRWTAQSALHFPPLADLFIPTPFSASLGSILAMQQLRNDYSLTFPPLEDQRRHTVAASQNG